MSEKLNFSEVDSSVLSKVINGKRLFTQKQLDIFCNILNLNERQKFDLTNALIDDTLERHGISKQFRNAQSLIETIQTNPELTSDESIEMSLTDIPKTFRDANYNEIPYDGSQVEWRVSAYAVVIENSKLLVIKSDQENFFDIPGGGVNMGEKIVDAITREGLEESGYRLKATQPIATNGDWFYHTDEKKFYRSLQMYWLAQVQEKVGKPTDTRYDDPMWIELDKLDTIQMYPNILTALEAIPK